MQEIEQTARDLKRDKKKGYNRVLETGEAHTAKNRERRVEPTPFI